MIQESQYWRYTWRNWNQFIKQYGQPCTTALQHSSKWLRRGSNWRAIDDQWRKHDAFTYTQEWSPKEWNPNTHDITEEPMGHCAKWNKPARERGETSVSCSYSYVGDNKRGHLMEVKCNMAQQRLKRAGERRWRDNGVCRHQVSAWKPCWYSNTAWGG